MDESKAPERKVTAGALGGAAATLIIGSAVWLGAVDPPVGFEGAVATVIAFTASYMTRE